MTPKESHQKALDYIEMLKKMTGAQLFNEILVSGHRRLVALEIKSRAREDKMKPSKWMAIKLQPELIEPKRLHRNQSNIYGAFEIKK